MSWPSGLKITLESFIPPKPNVLVLRWRIENWNEQTRLGDKRPLWFSLYRWADPTIEDFAARFFADYRDFPAAAHEGLRLCSNSSASPLAPPMAKNEGDRWTIEQSFPAEPTFPSGFSYRVTPLTLYPIVAEDDYFGTVPMGAWPT